MAHRRVPAGDDQTTVLIAPPLRPARPPQRGPLYTATAFAAAYVAYTGAAGLSSKLPHPPAPLAGCLVLAICAGLVYAAYATLARQQRQTDEDVRRLVAAELAARRRERPKYIGRVPVAAIVEHQHHRELADVRRLLAGNAGRVGSMQRQLAAAVLLMQQLLDRLQAAGQSREVDPSTVAALQRIQLRLVSDDDAG